MLSGKDNTGRSSPDDHPGWTVSADNITGETPNLTSHEDGGEQITTNSGQVQCSVCSSTFRRPEHLKRHLRSHTKEKPFECAQCGRHFSRTDTLHRHELSHHTAGSEGGKDRTHRITVRTFRACFNCATARVRCSGGIPCERCDNRLLKCQYPTERRSRFRAGNSTTRDRSVPELPVHEQQSPRISSPQGNRQHDEHTQAERTASYYVGQFTVTGLNNPQNPIQASEITDQLPAGNLPGKTRSNKVGSRSDASNLHSYIPSGTTPTSARVPLSFFSEANEHRPYADVPKVVSKEPTTALDSGIRGIHSGMPDRDVDMEMDISTTPDMAIDPSFCDPPMSKAVNWISNEIFTVTTDNQFLSSVVPVQYSPRALSESSPAAMIWQPPVIHDDRISSSVQRMTSRISSGHPSLGTDTGSPQQFSHAGSEASAQPKSAECAMRSADYYVDGGNTRLPRYTKRGAWSNASAKVTDVISQFSEETTAGQFDFPRPQDLPTVNALNEVTFPTRSIDTIMYTEIKHNFLLLCRSQNPIFKQFGSDNFPSADDLSRYIACYFNSFHAVYPIVHSPTFDPNKSHWLLTLSIAAIGCHSASGRGIDQCTAAFHEMIRRALYVERERMRPNQASIDIVQAMLLSCVGFLHGGNEQAKISALSIFKDLAVFMDWEQLLASSTRSRTSTSRGASDGVRWLNWIRDETRRRTGYCIWLLDSTLAYAFDERPLLSLDSGQAALPAQEKLWQAQSAEAWKQLWDNSSVNDSLYDAMHILFIEKRLVSGIGELGHILLVHALYHRMWEVGDYLRRPLSFWNPTAKKESRQLAIPTGSVWLPGIPSYSKWRNSACDCLDILHWTANSTIAKAAGLEHPILLHLHSARIILLAPFREIRSLATSLSTDKVQWSKRYQTVEWQYIWRWTKHDQYKARLSVIHAGVTLWHVRRYSTNAFHEPVAAFLAILILWAYGSCYAHVAQNNASPIEAFRVESLQKPGFIHLDRPCDDELVQLFVREGHSMKGIVTGVGDICAPEGPERILNVGCEKLASLTSWGISKRFITILSRLADLASQQPGDNQDRDVDLATARVCT